MKITKIDDMITDATFQKVFEGKNEILNMERRLGDLTKKIDGRVMFDVIDKALQPAGYINFIDYIRAQKYPLNSTFKTAQKSGLIVGQVEFLMIINSLKQQGIYDAFLNIANEYAKNSELDRVKGTKNVDDALFVANEKTLNRELDVLDYVLYAVKQKTKPIEPQRV